jgi:hypothetical protein
MGGGNEKELDDEKLLLAVTEMSLLREGAPQRQDSKFQRELLSGREPHSGLEPKADRLTG